MRNILLTMLFVASLSGSWPARAVSSPNSPATGPASSSTVSAPAPAAPAAAPAPASATQTPRAQPAIRFALVSGKLLRISDVPAQTINGVVQPESISALEVAVPVASRVVTINTRKYRVDHVDRQIVSGQAVPTLEAVTELPPDQPCPATPGQGIVGFWDPGSTGPPLPDVVVDGVKVSGRTEAIWFCQIAAAIVGGQVVREATPWQAEIYSDAEYTHKDMLTDARLVRTRSSDAEFLNQRQSFEYHHHCGAVMIADDWVLTAQHCIVNAQGKIDPGYFTKWRRIRIGTHDLTSGGTTVAIKRVVLHPDFNERRYRNDIALIQIVPDARTDRTLDPRLAAPIRMLGTREVDYKQPGAFGTFMVYGWGTQSQRKDSDPDHLDDHGQVIHESRELQRVSLNFVAPEICKGAANYRGLITSEVICAGYAPGGRDSCQGDSGGPLVATYPDGINEQVLAGIVSGGVGCALADTPGIYTYVPRYLKWIVSVIGADALVH